MADAAEILFGQLLKAHQSPLPPEALGYLHEAVLLMLKQDPATVPRRPLTNTELLHRFKLRAALAVRRGSGTWTLTWVRTNTAEAVCDSSALTVQDLLLRLTTVDPEAFLLWEQQAHVVKRCLEATS